MSSLHEHLPPLAPELSRLLDAERPVPPLSPEARARIRSGVRGGAPGGGGGAGPAPHGGGSVVTALIGVLVGVVATLVAQRALGPTPATTADPPAAARQASSADRTPERVRFFPAPDPSTPAHEPTPPIHEPSPAVPAKQAATRSRPAPARALEPATPPASSLGREREILDAARAAIVRGNPAGALEAVERHRREHPDGSLAEEREVLAVQALAALGRASDARLRAAAFRARWPSSLLGTAVDRAAAPPDER